MSLHFYGENGFTVLLFQALQRTGLVTNVLLRNLKQFRSGRRFFHDLPAVEEPAIWLFPNFGKAHGFGEPDALVLLGLYSFWFEVETSVNVQRRRSALDGSLIQLLRYHYCHEAMARGAQTRGEAVPPELAIAGLTVNDKRLAKAAILRIEGHPVLQVIGTRLANSIPHYVLLTQRKPRGSGNYKRDLADAFDAQKQICHKSLAQMELVSRRLHLLVPQLAPVERCWYAYWNGFLAKEWRAQGQQEELSDWGYVGIRV